MNYSPYMMPFMYAPAASTASRGLISSLFGGSLNFGSILSGTGKVLNVANQAIPIVKQASPLFKNAKTMFKVMNEFKKVDTKPISSTNPINKEVDNNNNIRTSNITIDNDGGPTFFM